MPAEPQDDRAFLKTLFQSISADLAMIMDTEVSLADPEVTRATERAAGLGQVHISFRFSIHQGGEDHQGCVLVPLPDAITLAGHLMMLEPEELGQARERTDLDRPLKEALIEVGNFIAGAIDAVIRTWYPSDAACRSNGCQGVRADVRPALEYEEGAELVIARSQAQVGGFDPYSLILQIPPPSLEPAEAEKASA